MPDPAPAGWLSLSFDAIANVLAASAGFRTLMGAADAASAKAKIYLQDVRGTVSAPYAVVMFAAGSIEASAARIAQRDDDVSVMLVWPEQRQAGDTANGIALRAFNTFGQLLDELTQLVGTGTTYPIRAAIDYEPPARCPDDHQRLKDCWDASITFRWSL